MHLLEYFLILLWMVIVPFTIGTLITNYLFKRENTDILLNSLCGYIGMFAIFYVLVIPMLFLKIPLHVLIIFWSTLTMILCIISIAVLRKLYKDIFIHAIHQIRKLPLLTVIVIILIFFQAFVLIRYVHSDADDAFYVANATTAAATDSIFQFDAYTGALLNSYPRRYVFSPFPIFIALLSKLVLIHPAIVAHTVIPAVLIPLSYVVFALLGKKLFRGNTVNIVYFLLFLSILNIFGNVSVYTPSSFLLFRIWQGKAVLANIILPAIMYFYYQAMTKENSKGGWLMLFLCVLSACLVSSMGVALATVMILCLGVLFSIRTRNVRTLLFSIACCAPCIIIGIASVLI